MFKSVIFNKIYKSFINGLEEIESNDFAITKTIIDLSKNLKLDVIAEENLENFISDFK